MTCVLLNALAKRSVLTAGLRTFAEKRRCQSGSSSLGVAGGAPGNRSIAQPGRHRLEAWPAPAASGNWDGWLPSRCF